MRFSAIYRLTALKGFFWAGRFYFYGARWGSFRKHVGFSKFRRQLCLRLTDGFWGQGYVRRQRFAKSRVRNANLNLLHFWPAQSTVIVPWAWRILYYLRIRSYRGNRYKLGLPARGQRSRTNASTAGRNRDQANLFVLNERWSRRLGEARKQPSTSVKKNLKRQKSGKKVDAKLRKNKGTVRSKDKKKMFGVSRYLA